MNSILQYIVLGTEVHVRVINEVSVSERLFCASLPGHAFGDLHVCPNNGDVLISGVQQKGFDSTLIAWVHGCG